MLSSASPQLPRFLHTPSFRAASQLTSLVAGLAAALPPEWRFLAVHLRRNSTLILRALTLAAGLSGKHRRKVRQHARLRAFDLVGAIHAVTAAPGADSQQVEAAGLMCLRLVRLLAPER